MKKIICASCGNQTQNDLCSFCNNSPLLEGKYRLHRLLGEGGQGTVFFATDSLGREVAIKRFRLGVGMDIKEWESLDREIQILRQLEHSQIPNYIDHFRAQSGPERYLYLVQEYVEGENLKQSLETKRYTPTEVMRFVAQTAEVLMYLHGFSPPVIHRDIKPGNLMQRADGQLYLIDFGCVRDSAMNTFGATMGVGTFLYMAPEQHHGDVRASVDIYSLGVSAGHLLSGTPPNALRAWRRDRTLAPAILSLMDSMLQQDPLKRPSAKEVHKMALEAIANPSGKQSEEIPVTREGKTKVVEKLNKLRREKDQRHETESPARKKKIFANVFYGGIIFVVGIRMWFSSGVNIIGHERHDVLDNAHDHLEHSATTHEASEIGDFSVPQSPEKQSEEEQVLRDILIHDFFQGETLHRETVNEELDTLCGEGYEPACLWKERHEDSLSQNYELYTADCIEQADALSCMVAGWGATQSASHLIDDQRPKFIDGIEYLLIACQKGNQRACADLGYVYEKSTEHSNLEKAYQLYSESCQHGIMWGCSRVGWFYDSGKHVAKDIKKSNQYFRFSCQNGNGDGCRYHGDFFADPVEKLNWYSEGCEKGSRMSCNSAAIKYENGEGAEKNIIKATELYTISCEAKNGYACYNLGWVYKDGRLGSIDFEKARSIFGEACQLQHNQGCYNSGKLLLKGEGGDVDQDLGWKNMFQSCEGGYYSACHYIGYGYANGKQLEQNGEKALSLYKQACDNEIAVSCNNIGSLYYNGKLFPQDKLKAYTYFQKACGMKNQMACDNIEMMKNKGDLDF